jgi:hypothetical protein
MIEKFEEIEIISGKEKLNANFFMILAFIIFIVPISLVFILKIMFAILKTILK